MGTLNRRLPIALAVALLFAAEAPAQIARVFLSGTGDDLTCWPTANGLLNEAIEEGVWCCGWRCQVIEVISAGG